MSHNFGGGLLTGQIILLFVAAGSLFFFFHLFRAYRRTNHKDYLFISLIFLAQFINMPIFVFRHNVADAKILWILNVLILDSAYLWVFFTGSYTTNERIPALHKIIGYGGVIFFVIIKIFAVEAANSDIPMLFGLQLTPINIDNTLGWATFIGSMNIVGTNNGVLTNVWRVAMCSFCITKFATLEMVDDSSANKRAKIYWIIAIGFWALYAFLTFIRSFLPTNISVEGYASISALGGIFYLGIIAVRNPHSLLLTKAQLLRARDLYQRVISSNTNVGDLGIPNVVNYLNALPDDVKVMLNEG